MKLTSLLLLLCLAGAASLRSAPPPAAAPVVPAPADGRIATTQIRVVPDRPGWTYAPGEPAGFHVTVLWDQQPLEGVTVRYTVGPEMMPAEEQTAVVPAGGLVIAGGTLAQPGFIRCSVTAEVGGRTYRALATAGFAPDRLQPTQTEPADFDAFWAEGRALLDKIPLAVQRTLLPEVCTPSVNVYQVSFQNWSPGSTPSRIYGILCEPKAPGRYPAILRVPGAGVRPYPGEKDLAARGAITLDIGIHGIPVVLPPETYTQLAVGALSGYNVFNLDDRSTYYYRRVYLGCLRACDFLASLPNWDGRNLAVFGGSQGGQLSLVTAALDPRVTALAVVHPAYCDVTGYLHGRAGGWPHMLREEKSGHRTPAKIATTGYYDAVNFARRVRAPGFYTWGYNDVTCPPTSMYAAYNVITAPKELQLALEAGHYFTPEQTERINRWLLTQVGIRGD